MPNKPATFEIGLAMAGAISAGAYSAGVIDFLFQALDAWEQEKRKDREKVPNHSVVIKVITGASAGSITGALAAAALGGGITPTGYDADQDDRPANYHASSDQPYRYVMRALYTAWVVRPDMAAPNGSDLLDTSDLKKGGQVASLLNSSVLDAIGKEALTIRKKGTESLFSPACGGEKIPYVAEPLHLYMTLSNLRGVPYQIPFEGGYHHGMLNHADRAHYILHGLGAEPLDSVFAKDDHPCTELDVTGLPASTMELTDENPWADYLQAALASSAFPLGLAARRLSCSTADYKERKWPMHVDAPIAPDFPWTEPRKYSFINVDGGLINNEPFEFARYALSEDGSSPNERRARFADRAVIMVDPFPEDPNFQLDEKEENLQLTSIMSRLFTVLKDQTRFKPEELAEALNEHVYSRFLIAPRRSAPGSESGHREDFPIATGLLGGFGGFLDRRLRAFDYQLGREHCQRFLREEFGLDPENDLFKDWSNRLGPDNKRLGDEPRFGYTNQRGEKRLCIIPLVGDAGIEIKLPPWPRLAADRLQEIDQHIDKRVRVLVPRLIESQTTRRFLRSVLKIGWSIFGPDRVREYVHLKIQQDLIRRDQHSDFDTLDDEERKVFAALSDPAFDLRTFDGLERSTALSRKVIEGVFSRQRGEIYVARHQAPGGGDGYTLASRKPGWWARNIGSLKFG